jgi:hypothetical protein
VRLGDNLDAPWVLLFERLTLLRGDIERASLAPHGGLL